MYFMPYGTVLKLRALGIPEFVDSQSKRTLFHVTIGERPCPIVDNGLVNDKHWRFINYGYGLSFDFSEDDLPIKLTITDRGYEVTNKYRKVIRASLVEEGQTLIAVFRAFYTNRYSDFIIEDKREMILLERKNRLIASAEERKIQLESELSGIDSEIENLKRGEK